MGGGSIILNVSGNKSGALANLIGETDSLPINSFYYDTLKNWLNQCEILHFI